MGRYTVYSSIDNSPAELWLNNKFACKLTFPKKNGDLHNWTQSVTGTLIIPERGLYLLTLKFSKGVNYGHLYFLYNEAWAH